MPLQVLDGPVIRAGEFLSDVLDCSHGEVVRITMPGDWTEADITFQVSTDGVVFNDLFDEMGYEIKAHVVPAAAVLVPADAARAITYLKVRSGTRVAPVPQAADRVFAVATKVGSGNA